MRQIITKKGQAIKFQIIISNYLFIDKQFKWKKYQVQFTNFIYQMKERNSNNDATSKSGFLDKFAGKLNVMTKHGQIIDQQTFKLPLINNSNSKRSNTVLFRSSKKSLLSDSSQYARNITSKSAVTNQRIQKYLTHNKDKSFVDLSNSFLKNRVPKTLKISRIINHVEPLSAVQFSKKVPSIRQQNNQNNPFAHMENIRHSDYSNFLNQLDMVSRVVKHKRTIQ